MGTLREAVARTAMGSQGGMTHHYQNPVAIRFGAGSIVELSDVLADRRAVLVTFPEAEGLGLVARVRAILGPALVGIEDADRAQSRRQLPARNVRALLARP